MSSVFIDRHLSYISLFNQSLQFLRSGLEILLDLQWLKGSVICRLVIKLDINQKSRRGRLQASSARWTQPGRTSAWRPTTSTAPPLKRPLGKGQAKLAVLTLCERRNLNVYMYAILVCYMRLKLDRKRVLFPLSPRLLRLYLFFHC